jgi:predicted Rossmann fold flavoprotein
LQSKFYATGHLLITHWGLSGPAILKLSAFAARHLALHNYHFNISINWLPFFTAENLQQLCMKLRLQLAAQKINAKNPFHLPQRLWQYFLEKAFIPANTRWADLTARQQHKLIQILTAQEFEVKGKTTFKEEFVTCGGIQLTEIDVQTMQSKIIPQLFFAGEIMNVDGITGGFNFQHAWTSGYIAAKHIAEMSLNNFQ